MPTCEQELSSQERPVRHQPPHALQWPSLVLGIALGAAGWWVVSESVYVNWRSIVSPIGEPLVLRKDAKGDGRFGAPRSGNRRHRGIDIVAPVGSPVFAIRSGQVIATGLHRGLGRYVELEHRDEVHSLYAHLDTIGVAVGERIRQGQAIGTVGKTGNAHSPLIQPHLHLEISRAGQPLDPGVFGLALTEPIASESDASIDRGG
ncbi:MAG: M23 family metallopeptidase [Candidatus Omnitrophica bacterium]|nr:M23 family metallopeptidase [Candidatus Omnitrophota bacterium]